MTRTGQIVTFQFDPLVELASVVVPLHDFVETFAALRTGSDFFSQQISSRQMSESVPFCASEPMELNAKVTIDLQLKRMFVLTF
jgi:hypothetical protein